MLTCPQCQDPIDAGQKFCPACGTPAPPSGASDALDDGSLPQTLALTHNLDPTAPVVIDNRFEILGELGKGGYGVVYKVRDQQLGVIKALKVPTHVVEGGPLLKKFNREMRILLRLSHENIVPIRDTGVVQSGLPYYTMDFCPGITVHDVIKAEGPFEIERFMALANAVLPALSSAHRHGVLHRDLKPANMMLVEAHGREEYRLLDFGIGKIFGDEAHDASMDLSGISGTPAYMAPEQVEGGEIDERSDVYGIAATFYQILTGRPPFSGKLYTVLDRVRNVAPESPRSVDPDRVPVWLEACILKGLAKTPEDRYPNVDAFHEALLAGHGGSAITPSVARAGGASSPPKSRPKPALSGGSGALAGLRSRLATPRGKIELGAAVAILLLGAWGLSRGGDNSGQTAGPNGDDSSTPVSLPGATWTPLSPGEHLATSDPDQALANCSIPSESLLSFLVEWKPVGRSNKRPFTSRLGPDDIGGTISLSDLWDHRLSRTEGAELLDGLYTITATDAPNAASISVALDRAPPVVTLNASSLIGIREHDGVRLVGTEDLLVQVEDATRTQFQFNGGDAVPHDAPFEQLVTLPANGDAVAIRVQDSAGNYVDQFVQFAGNQIIEWEGLFETSEEPEVSLSLLLPHNTRGTVWFNDKPLELASARRRGAKDVHSHTWNLQKDGNRVRVETGILDPSTQVEIQHSSTITYVPIQGLLSERRAVEPRSTLWPDTSPILSRAPNLRLSELLTPAKNCVLVDARFQPYAGELIPLGQLEPDQTFLDRDELGVVELVRALGGESALDGEQLREGIYQFDLSDRAATQTHIAELRVDRTAPTFADTTAFVSAGVLLARTESLEVSVLDANGSTLSVDGSQVASFVPGGGLGEFPLSQAPGESATLTLRDDAGNESAASLLYLPPPQLSWEEAPEPLSGSPNLALRFAVRAHADIRVVLERGDVSGEPIELLQPSKGQFTGSVNVTLDEGVNDLRIRATYSEYESVTGLTSSLAQSVRYDASLATATNLGKLGSSGDRLEVDESGGVFFFIGPGRYEKWRIPARFTIRSSRSESLPNDRKAWIFNISTAAGDEFEMCLVDKVVTDAPSDPRVEAPFLIDRYEATFGRYETFLSTSAGQGRESASEGTIFHKSDRPVVGITHADATAFATASGLALPSPDEWLVAAGWNGERLLPYPWGDQFSDGGLEPLTFPISASRQPESDLSPFGLYGMGGSVQEWCEATDGATLSGWPLAASSALKDVEGLPSDRCKIRISDTQNTFGKTIGFRCALRLEPIQNGSNEK